MNQSSYNSVTTQTMYKPLATFLVTYNITFAGDYTTAISLQMVTKKQEYSSIWFW